MFLEKHYASQSCFWDTNRNLVSVWTPITPQYRDPGLLHRNITGPNGGLLLRPYGVVFEFGRVFHLERGLVSPDDLVDVLSPLVFLASGITKLMFGHFKTFLTVLSPPVSKA